MADEQDLLKRLIVDEKEVLKDLEKLIDKAQKIFLIQKPSGKIIFRDISKLSSDSERICALLSAKYFAMKAKLIGDHSLGVSEIGKEIGRPATALSGPLKQLLKKGYIQKISGSKYEISFHRLEEVLNSILEGKGNVRSK